MRLSIVIPCYNELRNLPILVDNCLAFAEQSDVEIIFVDNGSTDGSAALFVDLLRGTRGMQVVTVEKNQGYGYGILMGLRQAKGDLLCWTHADLQTNPLDALEGLRLFDLHSANIFVKGKRFGRAPKDVIFTVAMSFFETILFRRFFWDVNAQPTMFTRAFFESWKNPPHDFSLDLYAYYLATQQQLPIHRFPVLFSHRLHGHSHWNINWTEKQKFIKRTISYSLKLKKSL